MLRRQERLVKQKDFDAAYRSGRTISNRLLTLKYSGNHLPYNRFGVVVSTKVDKRAVYRNKIKRRIRAVLAGQSQSLLPGTDFVLIAKKESGQANSADLADGTKELLGRSGRRRP